MENGKNVSYGYGRKPIREKFSAPSYHTKYASEPIIASFMRLTYSCCCCLLIRSSGSQEIEIKCRIHTEPFIKKCRLFPVHKLRATNFLINPTLIKGWGFCNKMCQETNKLFDDELQQLKIKILSDKLCKKFGTIYANNKLRLIANTKKELCGGFVNNVNVTIANYTLEQRDDKK